MECETCQGEGEVFQESGAGIHATANMGWVECPDCDGGGEVFQESGAGEKYFRSSEVSK